MVDTSFTEGDEVQHKTGGPQMIYTGRSQTGEAICEWFDGKGRKQDVFAFSALKKYEKPAAGAIRVGRA